MAVAPNRPQNSTPLGDLVIEMVEDDGVNVRIKTGKVRTSLIENLFRPVSEKANFLQDFSVIDGVKGDDTVTVNGTTCNLLETPYTVLVMEPAKRMDDGTFAERDKDFHIIQSINRRIHKDHEDYKKQECISLKDRMLIGKKKH